MNEYLRVFIAIVFYLTLILGWSACTDAQRSKLAALGSPAKITCYSGGIKIYEGVSTGKVLSEDNSDGYFFRDSKTGENIEISGNCIIVTSAKLQ